MTGPDQTARLLAAATEFTFRPDYGHLNRMFSDDPELRDAVVVKRLRVFDTNADPDQWVILNGEDMRWSTATRGFQHDRGAATEFIRAEALALVPHILRAIEAERIPVLRRMVQERAKQKAEQRS